MNFISGAGALIGPILAVFVGAALVSLSLTPLIRRFVVRHEIVDLPDERRVNTVPMPRAGGLAIAAAFLAVSSLFLLLNQSLAIVAVPVPTNELAGLLLGGAAAAALGALDDFLDLRARWQLGSQVALAVFAVATGIVIDFINNPFEFGPDLIRFGGVFAAGFTIFWIVGMINSINFIDGLDGLSSGISLIASVTLGLISLSTQVNQPFVGILCFALAGSLLGFLRWNLHPATIFTGTAGVQFVGYTLAVLSVLGTAKVAVALLVLGVPIIDTFWIIVRRVSQGRSPFSADRKHIHHRLLDLGLSHRQTVFVIYGICIVLALLALLLSGVEQLYAFLGIFLAFGLVLFIPTRGAIGRPEELEADTYRSDSSDRQRPS